MEAEVLKEVIKKHKLWLSGKENGERADLQRADLRGAYLQRADLQRADLRDADLRRANLQDADLRRANLRGADLRHADLRRAYLQDADLRRANLQDADLRHADLRRAYLQDADLRRANLDFSCLPLWCGGKDIKIDIKIARQFLFHALAQDCDDEEWLEIRNNQQILDFVNKFHRVESECVKGLIKL